MLFICFSLAKKFLLVKYFSIFVFYCFILILLDQLNIFNRLRLFFCIA